MYEFTKSVAFRFPLSLQATNAGLVGETKRTAERVRQQAVGEVLCEQIGVLDEIGADVGRTVHRLAAILARGVDGGSVRVSAAEVTDGIVGFEGETERVNLGVASAQACTERCFSNCCRMVVAPRMSGSMGGTFGGGGLGGVPKSFSSNHTPRFTGEVSTPLAVMVRILAWPSKPRRGESAGKLTRCNWSPLTSRSS